MVSSAVAENDLLHEPSHCEHYWWHFNDLHSKFHNIISLLDGLYWSAHYSECLPPSACTLFTFFIFKNKRTGHEKTLEKWVKGCYHSATKIKGAFDWVSLVINTKVLKRHNYGSWKEGIVTVGTSVFLWHYLLPSQAFSGIIQLGSIHFTCECLRKGPCVSERVDHPSLWKQ